MNYKSTAVPPYVTPILHKMRPDTSKKREECALRRGTFDKSLLGSLATLHPLFVIIKKLSKIPNIKVGLFLYTCLRNASVNRN